MSVANVPSPSLRAEASPSADVGFDPTPLPHRRVDWRGAVRALAALRETMSSADIMRFNAALEGDDAERGFQAFLAEPAAAGLLRERPRLEETLDDFAGLRRLPKGSLGQAYRGLAEKDGIRVTDLVVGELGVPELAGRLPDPVRRWYRARGVASHDLLHLLTGYERTPRGELQIIAFQCAVSPRRVFRVGLLLGLLGTPLREWPALMRDLWRANRRGHAARIPRSLDWEALLALPVAEARAVLGIRL